MAYIKNNKIILEAIKFTDGSPSELDLNMSVSEFESIRVSAKKCAEDQVEAFKNLEVSGNNT